MMHGIRMLIVFGVNKTGGFVMRRNKIFISIIGASMFLASGCVEEKFETDNKKPVLAEDEIVFGASASFANDLTKTDYGDADVDNKTVSINWTNSDQLYIGSLDTRGNKARYMVQLGEGETGTSSTLIRQGDAGLQWTEATKYTFYGMYPTKESFTEADVDSDGVAVSTKVDFIVEEGNVSMNGYLPMLQKPGSIIESSGTEGNTGYTVKPDMRYAYMVASNEYSTETVDENGDRANVQMSFTSLVTALQFKLIANEISFMTPGTTEAATTININSISLYSDSGKKLCGDFSYNFSENTTTSTESSNSGYSRVTLDFDDPLEMKATDYCDFTMFLLPTASFESANKDLIIQIFYTINGVQYVKKATLGKEIKPQWKYFFKDMYLPKLVSTEVTGSNWYSGVEDNVLVSQISIPVAGNAFSQQYSGTDSKYYKEQVKTYTELWEMGVRGFEFKTSYGHTSENGVGNTLADEYFVCNGAELTSSGTTFEDAFFTLANMMTQDQYRNECMIIIATYKPHGADGPYNPQTYITHLENFLKGNNSENRNFWDEELLVQLNNESTADDLRGKIAIIVRIGDDDYRRYDNDGNDGNDGNDVKAITTTLPISIINNWGTSVDQWDKRYGSTYLTAGAYATSNESKEAIEDRLWGISTSSSGTWTPHSYNETTFDFKAMPDTSRVYEYTVNGSTGSTAFVQSWERVVPSGFTSFYSQVSDRVLGQSYYLWLNWPESVSEKKSMIRNTFNQSMTTLGTSSGSDIFINSLCGFFPVAGTTLPQSWYPHIDEISAQVADDFILSGTGTATFNFSNQGKGGDWASCSAELNKYTYDYLSNLKTQGPYGLVMMNYIGATATEFGTLVNTSVSAADAAAASLALPNLIMMNNFKFPLSTAPETEAEATTTASVKSWADEDCNGDSTETTIVWE